MAVGYRVTNVRMQSGERLPLLVAAGTGVPLWGATLFLITELRATNCAEKTLAQAARAILVAHQALDYLRIDPDARLAEGRLLDIGELDALVGLAGLTQEALDALVSSPAPLPAKRPKVVSLEKVRMRAQSLEGPREVGSETKGIRLIYIRRYLEWLVRSRLLRLDHRAPLYPVLTEAARQLSMHLEARTPSSHGKAATEAREGLSPEAQKRLREVIHPDSADNPWSDEHTRVRNYLIVMWLLELGIRRGELLGLRIGDIQARGDEVLIARRPDDPLEVRADAPATKTKARLLALSKGLSQLTQSYVLGPRRAIKDARRHPYLFVASGTGKPLTASAIGKLFSELRSVQGIPPELSAHVLRHTWNDNFSVLMDKMKVPPDEEVKLRRQQMGWSDNSEMAATYTRRHTRRKTNEASLALQAATFEAMTDKK